MYYVLKNLTVIVCFVLQSFPQGNEKIKAAVLSNLYAFQVPPPTPIPTMSAEEEKGYDQPGSNLLLFPLYSPVDL